MGTGDRPESSVAVFPGRDLSEVVAFATADLLKFPFPDGDEAKAPPVQVLAWGINAPVDGRPPITVDDAFADAMLSAFAARTVDVAIDYNHATLMRFQDAPAAGWITGLTVVRPADTERPAGIWLQPAWTARGRERIRSGEYRYMSAVLRRDWDSGAVLPELMSAALTNDPAIHGLAAVAASRHNSAPEGAREGVMSDLKELGFGSVEEARTVLSDLKAKVAKVDALSAELDKTTNELAEAKAKAEALSSDLEKERVEAFLREGKAAGKITAGDKGNEPFARTLAAKDMALARQWLDGQPEPGKGDAPTGRLALSVEKADDDPHSPEAMDKRVRAYSTEHKCSYGEAYERVSAELIAATKGA